MFFACCSSKNYSFEEHSKATGELVNRICHIRGFSTKGKVNEHMNPEIMLEMIQALQENKVDSRMIPQFTLKINNQTRLITSATVEKVYRNTANTKRWHDASLEKGRLFAFGVTQI